MTNVAEIKQFSSKEALINHYTINGLDKHLIDRFVAIWEDQSIEELVSMNTEEAKELFTTEYEDPDED